MRPFNIILLLLVVSGSVLVTGAEESHDHGHEARAEAAHGEEENHDDDHEARAEAAHGEEAGHDDDHKARAETAHGEADHEGGAAAGVVELSAASIRAAGIRVTVLEPEVLPEFISAPGEIQLNQYRSAVVSPLIDAVVVRRLARLGDVVEAGQHLVTLSSLEVAAAQGELMIRATDWERVRKLGRESVSAKRYIEAEVAYQQARLRLLAYGLDEEQVGAIAGGNLKSALGEFDLHTPLAGTLVRDDFRVGERVEAGRSLFVVADEDHVWVEANLTPHQAEKTEIGMPAEINIAGDWHHGTVIQKHHLLDEQTRTILVRIALEPGEEDHHPGEFVQVAIALHGAGTETVLVAPEAALMRDGAGNWTVFVELEQGHFKQTRVSRGAAHRGKIPISGIAAGTPVVTEGAFYLAAELAKSGFDIHSH